MLAYVLNSRARWIGSIACAVVAVLIALVFYDGFSRMGVAAVEYASIPFGFIVYAIVSRVYDRLAWALPVIQRLHHIPVLHGEWSGTVLQSGADTEADSYRVYVTIRQRLRSMQIIIRGPKSQSRATMAALRIGGSYSEIRLGYVTEVEEPGGQTKAVVAEGVLKLRVLTTGREDRLVGPYFTSKSSTGTMQLTRISRRVRKAPR